MIRETLRFASKGEWLNARLRDVTSTETSVLFGKNKYMTPYKLWWIKKNGLLSKNKQNDRMSWGIRLQDSIAMGIGEDHGFTPVKMEEYIRIPSVRIGSSFDFRIGDDTLFEIKNVGADYFSSGWQFDKDDALAPPNIELQVQHQLAVSGFKIAYIGVLVGGNKPYLLRRERNEELIAEIFARVARFWESVDSGIAPDPNLDLDSDFISELYCKSTPDKVLDGDDDVRLLVDRYRELSKAASSVEGERSKIKAKLLMRMGDAEKIIGEGYKVCAGTVAEKEIKPYTRAAYRSFRVIGERE